MHYLKSTAKIAVAVGVMIAVMPLVTSLILVTAFYNRREQRFGHLNHSL